MPVSTPKYKNLFCQTLKKQVLIRGFLLYSAISLESYDFQEMDNLESCGSPIEFCLIDIFVSLKRTNLFFFTDLYLLSNLS